MERGRTRPLVLLADDSPTQLQQLAQVLESAGFRVRQTTNGRQALEEARRWRPDLIVSDILMPVMDGFALCRDVRRDPVLDRVPVVLYTITFVDQKDEEFAIGLGATRFVVNSADPTDLVAIVREVLATGHQPRTVPAVDDADAFIKGYAERLTAQLEQTVADLEDANRRLDQRVEERTAELAAANEALKREVVERQAAEAKFRALFEFAPGAIVIVDQTGEIVLVNARGEQLLGYERGELVGQPVEILVPERLLDAHVLHRAKYFAAPYERVMTGEREFPARRKDRSEFPAEISHSSVEAEDGVLIMSVIHDITERKQVEEERVRLLLREQEARAAAEVARQRVEVLYVATRSIGENLNLEQVLVAVSDASRRLFGADRGVIYFQEGSGRIICPILFGSPPAETEPTCQACSVVPLCDRAGAVWPPACVIQSLDESETPADLEIASEDGPVVFRVPLLRGDGPPGFLALYHDGPRSYATADVQVVRALANHAAIAIANARLYDAEQHARALVAESEARFRRLAENAQDVVYRYELRPRQGYSYVSPVATEMFGYTPEEICGDPDQMLSHVHPDDLPIVQAVISGRHVPRQFTARMRHKDGRWIWVERRIALVHDDDGNLVAIEGIARDITERKRAEEERVELAREQAARAEAEAAGRRAALLAEASRAFSEASLELQPVLDVVARCTVELVGDVCLARLRSINGQWLAPAVLYHPNQEVLAALREIWTAVQHGVDEGLFAEVMRTGQPALLPVVLPEQVLAAIGPEKWHNLEAAGMSGIHSVLIVPLRARGVVIGVLGVARDRPGRPFTLADQELLQDLADRAALAIENARLYREVQERIVELRQAQQQLIQQERLHALGQMASGIGHDFNNALVPILGFSELLLTRPEDVGDAKRLVEYLKLINLGARDAASVVSRLREFYRSREEDEPFRPVDLNRLVEQVVELTQPKWRDQALANGVTIAVQTDLADVPALVGNEADLREALTNLVFNAVDAVPTSGTITLRTRSSDDSVVVEVRDTGIGMSEEVRKRCLEPFFTTKGERGTGLGLAAVYGIVRRHGGTVSIETAPGTGTAIALRLPIQTEAADAPQGPTTDFIRPLRVLVVDDEVLVRRVIAEYLAADHHTVELAGGGFEALEKLAAGQFDLVVTDLAMPDMRGDQLAAAVKQRSPETLVIMLTGFGDLMAAANESPPDVDLVVSKPVTLDALRQAIMSVLTTAPARPAGG